MARSITGTTNQHLYVDTGAVLSYPLTISCRLKPNASSNGIVVSYGDAIGGFVDANILQLAGLSGVGVRTLRINDDFSATYSATLAAGGWYLLVGVFNGSGINETSRQIYLNNGMQVAGEGSVSTPAVKNRTLTVGGVSVDVGSAVLGGDYEVADVALWNAALTSTDVDALALGRPGDVKAANLQAWYKLGSNGDLTSSVGTYGPMVEVGSCPITADPIYVSMADKSLGFYEASYRDYLPMSRIASPALDDPLARGLKFAFPITEYGCLFLTDPILQSGIPIGDLANNQWQPDGGYVGFGGQPERPYPQGRISALPITVSIWLKAFETYSGGGYFYNGNYSVGDGVYMYMNPSPDYRVIATHIQNHFAANASAVTTSGVSTTQWACITAVFEARALRRIYYNGKLEHTDTTVILPPAYAWDYTYLWRGWLGQAFLNTYRRDLRVWNRALSDREVFELYSRGYARNFRPVAPARQFPIIWENPISTINFPRLAGSPGLRPIGIKGTKAKIQFGRIQGSAGIRPGVAITPEQKLQFFRLAGSAGLRTIQVRGYPKVALPRMTGAAYLRPLTIKASPVVTFPRMAGYADLRALDIRTFRGLWHEELATLYANQIERERRVLLGPDSSLEMFTQRGMTTESRKTLGRDFSAYHVSTLAGPEEWFLDIIETGNPWDLIREITEVCVYTHGQCLSFKVLALERPVEKGHCYRMRLQAINDPRV